MMLSMNDRIPSQPAIHGHSLARRGADRRPRIYAPRYGRSTRRGM